MAGRPKSDKFEIEKRIPFPGRRMGADARYPWIDLEPGDSFFVPYEKRDEEDTLDKFIKRNAGRCQAASKLHKITVRPRAEKKNGVDGVRIWRVDNMK